MEQVHHLGQFARVEIHRPGAGVVPLEAEVDRIGTVLDGRDETRPIARPAPGVRA